MTTPEFFVDLKGHQLNHAVRIISVGMDNLLMTLANGTKFSGTNVRIVHDLIHGVVKLLEVPVETFKQLGLRTSLQEWTEAQITPLEGAVQVSTMYFKILDMLHFPGESRDLRIKDPMKPWYPTGASESQIFSLENTTLIQRKRCCICMEIMDVGETFPKLRCGHVCHEKCLQSSLVSLHTLVIDF